MYYYKCIKKHRYRLWQIIGAVVGMTRFELATTRPPDEYSKPDWATSRYRNRWCKITKIVWIRQLYFKVMRFLGSVYCSTDGVLRCGTGVWNFQKSCTICDATGFTIYARHNIKKMRETQTKVFLIFFNIVRSWIISNYSALPSLPSTLIILCL